MAARVGVPVSDVVIGVRGGFDDMAPLVLVEPSGLPLSSIDSAHVSDAILGDSRTRARLASSR